MEYRNIETYDDLVRFLDGLTPSASKLEALRSIVLAKTQVRCPSALRRSNRPTDLPQLPGFEGQTLEWLVAAFVLCAM